eukprot:Amastigsp_a676426_198.p6 type:complete len:106 gc:universal Amastigsp_a676426_198:1084-767(-)
MEMRRVVLEGRRAARPSSRDARSDALRHGERRKAFPFGCGHDAVVTEEQAPFFPLVKGLDGVDAGALALVDVLVVDVEHRFRFSGAPAARQESEALRLERRVLPD